MSLFRKEVYERRANSSFGDVRVASPFGHILVTTIIFLITVFIIIAAFTIEYSETVKVNGHLTPEKGLVRIISGEQGVVKVVHAPVGSKVFAGETLFEIETDQSLVSGDARADKLDEQLNIKRDNLRKRISIIENEYDSLSDLTKQNISLLEFEVSKLEQSVKRQEKIVTNEKEIFESFSRLASDQSASQLELSTAENRFLQSSQDLANLQNEIALKKSEITELAIKLKLNTSERQKDINQIESEILDVERLITEAASEDGYVIQAPIDGLLTSSLANVGKSVNNSEYLASLLPTHSALLAELFVPSKGIGSIEIGQRVKLFYDAFPYRRFGYFNGTITDISRSIVWPSDLEYADELQEPVFLVSVRLDEQSFVVDRKEVVLQPGMKLSANIILKRQKLVDFIIGPLLASEKV